MFEPEKKFARKHIILTSTNHFAGGFGVALLLQQYISGDAFLPALIGWILIGYFAMVHILEFISKDK